MKLKNRVEARKYVASAVAATLRRDIYSDADYLCHQPSVHADGPESEGNLADEVSEQRARKAAEELLAWLEKRSRKK